MKYYKIFIIVSILSLLYSSCAKKENYPDVPVITYNNFIPFCSGATTDSAYLLINFTDGNGDVGNIQQEGGPNNLFIIPLVYVIATNSYQPVFTDGDTTKFPYNIPNITPTGNDKELNGIIQINLENFLQQQISNLTGYSGIADLHKLQFEVWMYDRAGNKSNVLITPTVYTCE